MTTGRNLILTAAAVGSLASAPLAHALPVPFTVTAAAFSPGAGYGVDAHENGGSLLNVVFSTAGFLAQDFALAGVGDFRSFTFGSVDFKEPDTGSGANQGINHNEAANPGLGVTATLSFTNPLGATQNVLAEAVAVFGPIGDSAADYTLHWNPVTVDFGSGGSFRIRLDDLSFSGNAGGPVTETATITLVAAPESVSLAAVRALPEPSSVLLLGLGVVGLARVRRTGAR